MSEYEPASARSPRQRGPVVRRVAVLGGGHGVAAVLRALHHEPIELTVIVTIADDGGSSGELRRQWGGPAVGDMRRTLIALAGEDAAFARAFARPVTIARLGRHPLGNLVLRALIDAFGDPETASTWLCAQLSVSGCVLPATAGPVSLLADVPGRVVRGESAIGAAIGPILRLRFDPPIPPAPTAAVAAIEDADWVLLGPGSLFTSVIAVCAIPDIASALATTAARVLWLCNLSPQMPETRAMTAVDHLEALRRHSVRVDAVLYDRGAELAFTARQLEGCGLPALARSLRSDDPAVHHPDLLRGALRELFAARADTGATDRRCLVPN